MAATLEITAEIHSCLEAKETADTLVNRLMERGCSQDEVTDALIHFQKLRTVKNGRSD